MNHPLLELKNINLTLSNFKISDINITLHPGEIHVIMGENGSGKSMLMQIISGILSPDSGEIYVDGDLIKPKNFSIYSSKAIIYIQQNLSLLETLTVAENLFFHNLPYKNKFFKVIDSEKLNYQYQQLINELDLPIGLTDNVSTLGLAQRQIIEFCKAYISDAKIVILDEPSASLTLHERELLYGIVNHIKAKGAGVFYITHRIDDVLALGDRITIIKKGTLVGTKIVSESTSEEIIHMLSDNYKKDRYPKINFKKGRSILSVRNFGFEDKLKHINFELREGEILGITGLAGSGRTLLANCLFGVTKYSGEIYINGQLVKLESPRDAIHHGIALLPENQIEDSIFEDFDTNENVAFPSLHRFSKNRIINGDYLKQTVLDYIDKINIPKMHMSNFMAHSGGNKQKAIFAKWIMSRAKIFILDEPTRGIDLSSKIDIYNFINDLVKKKACVLYISSDIEEIFGICDRVAVLSENTLACDISIKDTTIEDIVKLATSERT